MNGLARAGPRTRRHSSHYICLSGRQLSKNFNSNIIKVNNNVGINKLINNNNHHHKSVNQRHTLEVHRIELFRKESQSLLKQICKNRRLNKKGVGVPFSSVGPQITAAAPIFSSAWSQ